MQNKFGSQYFLLNLMQMIERLTYWIIVIQMPIYISQKGVAGGLEWDQSIKGIIFFIWALTANLTPVFLGGLSDRYNRKLIFSVSFVMILLGYVLFATQTNLFGFIAGSIVFGAGSGLFKPTLQGAIAENLNRDNSSLGWSLNVMLINLAVFFGPPLSLYFKEINWQLVFLGSAAIFASNFIFLIFLKNTKKGKSESSDKYLINKVLKELVKPRVLQFVLIMSGFTIIYMQFYETLPNFIYDWVDTSMVAESLSLPAMFISETPRGMMISYEWLYNLNAGLVVIGVVPVALLMRKLKLTISLLIGIAVVTLGIAVAGFSNIGYFTILGMLIYTTGEMISNPKFAEFMARIAPTEDKSLYMGIMNVSWAIGLAGGGLLGGLLYKYLGEKSGFAQQYMLENYQLEVELKNAQQSMMSISGMNEVEMTNTLWSVYQPEFVWVPIVIIGVVSVIAMWFYTRRN